tara:strand:+ start:32 stop:190 length:159 start_codon:yes stop_codon:yes gene_type:complete
VRHIKDKITVKTFANKLPDTKEIGVKHKINKLKFCDLKFFVKKLSIYKSTYL